MSPSTEPTAATDTERKSRLAVLETRPTGTLLVHEIYASIQGESTYSGLPCTFVRLTGCPLRCRWCDTPHAFAEGRPMRIAEILAAVDGLAPKLVELTGGEPLAHPEANDLMRALADAGYRVLLETSGALPIDDVDPRVVIIMDLKCPSSGEQAANDYANLRRLKPTDEIKFVIADRGDFEWAARVVEQYRLFDRVLLASPVFGEASYAALSQWILDSGIGFRLQLQLHKHVWDPKARGV